LSSPTFLLQKSPSTIGIHIRQCSKGQCLMHTLVYIRHLPQGQCSRMAHRHLPKRKMLKNMAHIGVHCTLHKMAMLKNGTYLCKLQLHVDMGSIIHFCTDTNTQNRTDFTKSLNTRFITENAKTSTFILFKILWTFHHHVSWQASELLFLHHSIAKFDQQSNFHVEDDLMHKTSVFQVYNLRNFCLENC
jgi:hypothetical protein